MPQVPGGTPPLQDAWGTWQVGRRSAELIVGGSPVRVPRNENQIAEPLLQDALGTWRHLAASGCLGYLAVGRCSLVRRI